METHKKLALLVLPLLLIFASCKKEKEEVDTEAPVILAFDVNEKTSDIEVARGGELHLHGHFTDNKALKEYKVDIHNVFDGHGHDKVQLAAPFSFQQVYTLSGVEQHIHEHIDVPADADTGHYDIIINLVDAAGNEADFLELELEITE